MYRFHDKKIDTALFMQLQDLVRVLIGRPQISFEYAYGSTFSVTEGKITASTHWEKTREDYKQAGLKTDVYLRAIGTMQASEVDSVMSMMFKAEDMRLRKFVEQLFAILEDIRLEETIKHQRPGTKKLFDTRRTYYRSYFTQQLKVNAERGYRLDELFALIYLFIQADGPDPDFPEANEEQTNLLRQLTPLLERLFEAKQTNDVNEIVLNIVEAVEGSSPGYNDLMNEYFAFPITHTDSNEDRASDDIRRTDPLDNDDEDDPDPEDSDVFDETMPTWHKENENADHKQTFLQFELEKGTKTSLIGEGARETEEGDQALASIQGSSGESDTNDYSDKTPMPEKSGDYKEGSHGAAFGKDNRFAVAIEQKATSPTDEDINAYERFSESIIPYENRLTRTIDNMLEHKQTAPRTNLVAGRLSKKLISIATDEFPRLFYKKNEDDKEIDAVFSLLVDCSASMINKMDETKKGVILFHRVLKRLKIPHEIIGFWEEASDVRDNYQPNYFHIVHAFSDSLYKDKGAAIMQLEAQEDNRDGFSIRVARERMLTRPEKNRFLLVFSDGEPAAAYYEDNGIVDTHLAVSETRKQQIDVIGLFLAEGEITEQADALMKNIYDKERIIVPSVEELPDHFTPLLKKLLLKAI
ncbi:uncharacterized protein JNUCC1_00530 [Lentibacillus sp. JNUCC-1]|uniref:vWA domain-containing protein n=1 Tax=Lentibacillus sp. JNUCC-1 TaxID=2654513 RepID=UPI0012E917F9|nr:VWA domain-containing protein [Lentibacillus sp. JNUCC-1]MUV36726.1 uncharacterized protein [Lentibacillus sp. JNUCC-1]